MRRIMRLKGMSSHLYLVLEQYGVVMFASLPPRPGRYKTCRRQLVGEAIFMTQQVRRFANKLAPTEKKRSGAT